MKNILKIFCIFVFVLTILNVVSCSWAEEFSADMEISYAGQSSSTKVFVSKESVRMEMGDIIVITDVVQKKTFALNTLQKKYIEGEMQDPVRTPRPEKRLVGEIERTSQGKETVNGIETEKFIVRYEDGSYSGSVYQWVMEGKDLAVKIENPVGGWTMEYKNIQIADQPDSLFTIPSDYSKLEIPGK